jgi:zinc transport system substrate-binding protein
MRAIGPGTLVLALAVLASCGGRSSSEATGKVKVFAAIPPLADFVERVGGPYVEANVLVAPGQNPHSYEPTPKEMAGLAASQIYFSIGMPFEKALARRIAQSNPKLRIVDVSDSEGITKRRMAESEAEAHPEEGGHDHGAGALDPHVWLNPRYAKIIAATICQELTQVDPAHAAEYEKSLAALQADLDAVDARLRRAFAPLKGKEFMVFHPAFGYLADAYGLRQVSVEVEGKEPSARQLSALIGMARKRAIQVIFVQPQFSRKSAEAVAEAIGGAVVPLDDLGHDYIRNLEDMAAKIEKALAQEK